MNSEKGKAFVSQKAQEALRLFERHAPRLIITDLQMPIVDGFELVRATRCDTRALIREDFPTFDLPMNAYSGSRGGGSWLIFALLVTNEADLMTINLLFLP